MTSNSPASSVVMSPEPKGQSRTDSHADVGLTKSTITQRMRTPREDWIDHGADPMFARLRSKHSLSQSKDQR